jgi:predicted RND superfamily exporter protein
MEKIMKRILLPVLILTAVLFISYKTLYHNSEVRLKTPPTEAERIQTQKAQREDKQIEEMMGIHAEQDSRVKIPTH